MFTVAFMVLLFVGCVVNQNPCPCVLIDAPVCGSDGHTYPNILCLQSCYPGVKALYYGPCKHKLCVCPLKDDPVCGTDGRTHANELCMRNCNPGVRVLYKGNCDNEPCPCPLNYDPVCGSDGQTYPNKKCMLCKRGVQELHKGPCRRLATSDLIV